MPQRGPEPVREVVEAKESLFDLRRRAQEPQTGARMIEFSRDVTKPTLGQRSQRFIRLPHAFGATDEMARDQLRGGTRRLGTQIRGEIAQSEINLVPDR
jgi:hypothetical protein